MEKDWIEFCTLHTITDLRHEGPYPHRHKPASQDNLPSYNALQCDFTIQFSAHFNLFNSSAVVSESWKLKVVSFQCAWIAREKVIVVNTTPNVNIISWPRNIFTSGTHKHILQHKTFSLWRQNLIISISFSSLMFCVILGWNLILRMLIEPQTMINGSPGTSKIVEERLACKLSPSLKTPGSGGRVFDDKLSKAEMNKEN